MTTNAGAADSAKRGLGIIQDNGQGKSMDAIKRTFTPEFINRLDAIVHFNPLPEETVLQVVGKFLKELSAQLAKKKIELSISDEVKRWLRDKGFDSAYGARPLARTIDEHIKKPLADEILFGRLEKGGKVRVELKEDKPEFEFA
jgi:ATP-dependent Clp protease ATP-binding subunit ClpA